MTTNKSIEEMAGLQIESYLDWLYPPDLKVVGSHTEENIEFVQRRLDFSSHKAGFLAGAAAQKELSDKREAGLMAVIEECKMALEFYKDLDNFAKTVWDENRDSICYIEEFDKYEISEIYDRTHNGDFGIKAYETLTSINEKLEKLNGK